MLWLPIFLPWNFTKELLENDCSRFIQTSMTFQRLLKDIPPVFKDWKLMKNTDLHVKILLRKC